MKRISLIGLTMACSFALAHPSFENSVAKAGRTFKADLMVTHGCGDSATIRLIVDVPREILAVTPRVKAGWRIETEESDLGESRVVFGSETDRYTSRIIWSDGRLSSDYFDVFSFIVLPPDEETTLFFPATQVCEEGTDAYIKVPGRDSAEEDVAGMAPSLTVVKVTDSGAH